MKYYIKIIKENKLLNKYIGWKKNDTLLLLVNYFKTSLP